MAPFAALLAVLLAWGLVSGRLARYSVTLPIVLVLIGAVLTATQVVVLQLDTESVRILVELALSILLFADATEISARWLRSAGRLPLRMLALGFATGYLLFPGMSVWVVALLAAALAATDAALASPVISWPRGGRAGAARPGNGSHCWSCRCSPTSPRWLWAGMVSSPRSWRALPPAL